MQTRFVSPIHKKKLKTTFALHFSEFLPKKNSKLGKQIEFTKKTPYVQLKKLLKMLHCLHCL